MEKKEGIPAWVWVGCGCLLFPVIIAVVLGGVGFLTFDFLKGSMETMADPAKRDEAGRELLGADRLPEAFHVRAIMKFPFAFSLVVLGDGTPPAPIEGEGFEAQARSIENLAVGGTDDRRMLVYVGLEQDTDQTIDQLFTGRGGIKVDLGVQLQEKAELDRGDLTVRGQRVAWLAKRGALVDRRSSFPEPETGIYSELAFDCPDKKRRLGMLFHKLPDAETRTDLRDTPADPAYLQVFLDHFEVCN